MVVGEWYTMILPLEAILPITIYLSLTSNFLVLAVSDCRSTPWSELEGMV